MRRALFCLVIAACGGSKGTVSQPTPAPPGQSHEQPPPAAAPDAAAPGTSPQATTPPPGTPPGAEIRPPQPPPAAAVTIELKNAGETDLTFGITKGWGPVVFAYTGKPPRAKSVILFENACSASCDAAPEQVCPVCPVPQTKKEEQAMAKVEIAPPGGSVTVPWDGKVLAYEKAPGKKPCKCWRKAEPPADTYTIKACGIRRASVQGKASKPVCTEAEVTLGPGATSPRTISLTFAK